jgi:hypothetical protein
MSCAPTPGSNRPSTLSLCWGGGDFAERLVELQEGLEMLNAEAHELEERIADNVWQLLGGL